MTIERSQVTIMYGCIGTDEIHLPGLYAPEMLKNKAKSGFLACPLIH